MEYDPKNTWNKYRIILILRDYTYILPFDFQPFHAGIYGLITAVIINGKMDAANYSAYSGPLNGCL